MQKAATIVIIGAGFSGTLVASHLLRLAAGPLDIHLIERNSTHFARGVAYSTTEECHLLNVPARNMSAYPDDADHFLRWASRREEPLPPTRWVSAVSPDSFLPRRLYGDYLTQVLDDADALAARGVRLQRHYGEAISLREDETGVSLRFADGGTIRADKAVLAVGNFPPGDPAVEDGRFYRSALYLGNPWEPQALRQVSSGQSCLLIGSGLTMVDWAVALREAGYGGLIHCVSRRGLWPHAHQTADTLSVELRAPHGQPRVGAWLQDLRRHIDSFGGNWRGAIDALRRETQSLWKSLPATEKRRFLRHLRPFWDTHRHRLAPVVAEKLSELIDSGQLIRHTGRILSYTAITSGVEVLIRQRGRAAVDQVQVDAVINCAGSESDYRKLESPLIRDLLKQGLLHPDAVNLGLDVAPDGALINLGGKPSTRLYTLGPPRKGILWETTAVPEIRGQAKELAQRLLSKHGAAAEDT